MIHPLCLGHFALQLQYCNPLSPGPWLVAYSIQESRNVHLKKHMPRYVMIVLPGLTLDDPNFIVVPRGRIILHLRLIRFLHVNASILLIAPVNVVQRY